ncbi:UvrD-helicase domain-containing protein [Cytobacillus sp. SAFR-174]|uniref:UvrD-helicase domain-containing protein n=1 Tax=Cytobacillus sp. SAFR-174 TaxID=3436868 RepID=UPI003F7CE74D
MQLTDEQKNVINSNQRKILVKAGAGTGKTEVLTKRIIRILEENPNVSIKDMAIITFTNKATEELQGRLKKAFYRKWKMENDPTKKIRFRYELESLNLAQISTIHMFCKNVLEMIGPYVSKEIIYSPAFNVKADYLNDAIDETIENWIIEKSKNKKKIEHLKIMPVYNLKNMIKVIYSQIRTKGFDIDRVINSTKRSALLEMESSKKNLKLELYEILSSVSLIHRKYKYDRLDVEDLLEYTSKILRERSDIANDIRGRFKYIFIDEFQDTSNYQSEIFKIICDDSDNSPNLFVVGDIKQSIYEFRGADTNAYSRIEQWIAHNGSILNLSINWRSTPEVVHFVNDVFNRIEDNNKYHFKRDPLKAKENREVIELQNAYEWLLEDVNSKQPQLIADFIKNKIENKEETAENFTILTRKNYELEVIAEELNKKGIPFKILDSGNFYNQKEIVDMYKVLNGLLNPGNQSATQEAINTIFFQNNDRNFNALFDIIDKNQLIYNITPSQIIDFIIQRTGVFSRCSSQIKSNLNKLKEISRRLIKNEKLSLYQFINWFAMMISAKVDEPLADTLNENQSAVKLMTIHKSKGLEFPIVILPNLDQSISESSLNPEIIINPQSYSLEYYYRKYYDNNSIIKSSSYDETIDSIQYNVYSEELRVLYVALTRAKRKIIMCGKNKLKKDKICFQNWLKKD